MQFNSPETVAAYEWLRETYDRNGKYAAMLPPGVESWNDTGNNEAFLAGSIGYTHNAFSVYAQSKRDNNPVFPNIALLRAPTANNGDSRDGGNVGGWMTIFKSAPNEDLAKKLALELIDPANFNKMSAIGGGAVHAGLREPLDRRAARGRPELCDHQGAGQRREPVPRRNVAGQPERRQSARSARRA